VSSGVVAHVKSLVRLACLLAAACALAAPVLLGPATGAVLHLLGAEAVHHCACGMKPGECGCPECARLEERRRDDAQPTAFRVIKPACDDDDLFETFALPEAIEAPRDAVAPPALAAIVPDIARDRLWAPPAPEPPTPPPRSLST
jgi:hypothetical protein